MDESKLEAVKKEVRSVLISSKDGLSLKEFSNTYKGLLGKTLPYKEFGFHTYIDFLYNLTDVVHVQVDGNGTIQLYGIADDATKHIQKLVSRQRSNPNKNIRKVTRFNRNAVHTYEPKGRTFVPALMRGELIMLLKNYPTGIGYSSLVMAYKKIYGKELNLEWLSTDQDEKFKKLAEVIPEIEVKNFHGQLKLFHTVCQAKNELCPASDFQLQPRKEKVLNSNANDSGKEDRHLYSSAIPDSIKSNFVKVLKMYPKGILAVHFPIAYEMIIKKPLDIFELSYTSLLEIADALPDIFFYYKNPEKNNEWIFKYAEFSNEAPTITNSKSSDQNGRPIHQKFSSSSTFKRTDSLDIANHSLPFDVEELPSDGFNKFFPVYVSAVVNPGLFWVQLKTEETIDKHAKLEKELNDFYDENSYKYKMKDAHIIVGASCVAFSKSDDHWYRSEIVAIPSMEYVNVTFVDYGGIEKIQKYDLYYLKNDFKKMPRYAHKAKLAGVEPTHQQNWGSDAQARFLELTNSPVIMSKVDSMEEGIVSLFLCDTRKGKNIYINDTLENEGYAKFCFSNDGICRSLVKNITSGRNEVNSTNSYSHNQTNGKIINEHFLHSNGLKEQNCFGNRSSIKVPTTLKPPLKRRYVKRVCLAEGYTIHIIVVADSAYVSGGDLCNLFWTDKDADVLALKLKFKGVSIPMICVSDDSNSELFYQCRRYSVKGFQDTGSETSVKLYPLKCVMKILNTFGHPSAQLREMLVMEIKNLDLQNTFWKEYQDPEVEISNIIVGGNKCWNNLCLYDLTAIHTGLENQRLKLVQESSENINNASEIKKIEIRQRNLRQRMDEVSLICEQYAS